MAQSSSESRINHAVITISIGGKPQGITIHIVIITCGHKKKSGIAARNVVDRHAKRARAHTHGRAVSIFAILVAIVGATSRASLQRDSVNFSICAM